MTTNGADYPGRGERGPKGDHGQDGIRGSEGIRGPIGPIGRTGPTSPYLGRTQTLIIFAFIVVAFVLLAYRTETNSKRLDQNIFDACQQRAIITKTVPNCENLR